MSQPVPLFVELCAGLAAVSVRLQGGRHARPPVSRMGNKAGYATAILAAMGLRPGQSAERFLWCEPDPGCRALLTAYTDPELMREAADIIRGWKDEDPRALWERLRAEGPIREATGAEVARWALGEGWGIHGVFVGPGSHPSHAGSRTTPTMASRLDSLPFCPAAIAPDARTVDPREVARAVLTGQWSYRRGHPESGFNAGLLTDRSPTATGGNGAFARTCEQEAAVVERSILEDWPPVTIGTDCREAGPSGLPPGCVVYIDPPYVATTGYAADLPRVEVVRLARLWSEAGALVVISEAEPVEALSGWHAVEITGERRGQKRTFSKQQREWLTMNREPAVRPMVQAQLWGAA